MEKIAYLDLNNLSKLHRWSGQRELVAVHMVVGDTDRKAFFS